MSERSPNGPPNLETLIAFAAGELAGMEAEIVRRHVASHPEDARIAAFYARVHQTARADDGCEPSQTALSRARAIFKPLAPSNRPSWLNAASQIIANLLFDSRVQAASLRSAVSEERINLTFEAGGMEIDIQADRIEAQGERRWRLIGQVDDFSNSRDFAGSPIVVTRLETDEMIKESILDEGGSFLVEIPQGRFALKIGMTGTVVAVSPLELE